MTDRDRDQLGKHSRRQLKRRLEGGRRGLPLKVFVAAIAVGTVIYVITDRSTTRAQLRKNEHRTRDLLARIARYQELFHQAAVLDEDGDGNGEYGFLQQVGGLVPIPGLPTVAGLWQPDQNRGQMYDLAVATGGRDGVARLHGYRFTIYLHDHNGGTRETAPLPVLSRDPRGINARERRWSLYAWPERWNETGRHTYVITEAGAILRTDAAAEFEGDRVPPADAFPAPGTSRNATGDAEGLRWTLVEKLDLW